MSHFDFPDWVSHHAPHWERWLAPWAGQTQINAVEIGSFEGRSALWFLEHVMTCDHARLVCVDPWDGDWYGGKWPANAEANFDANVEPYGARVVKRRGRSVDVLPMVGLQFAPLAFAYVDGSHHAMDAARDALLCWEYLAPGGVLILDDYHWTNPKVKCPPRVAIDFLAAALPAARVEGPTADQFAFWKGESAA